MSNKHGLPATISEVFTPCFLVDKDKVENNAKRMIDTCQKLKVDLRSHTKTHKTIEAALIANGGVRKKIACSTLAECEFFANQGFDDILLAFPINAAKIPRSVKLINQLDEFHVLLSSPDNLQCLKDNVSLLEPGKKWSIFLELDCAYGRTGFLWDSDSILNTATEIVKDKSMKFQGLYNHCGESYDLTPDKQAAAQKATVKKILHARQILKNADIDVPVVGTGSTPTCNMATSVLSQLDEFHPGNYIFNDYEQVILGSCKLDDVACMVATRVVSQRRDLGLLIVDCGFTGMSHDGIVQRPEDFNAIKDNPHLILFSFSQELGKIKAKEGERIDFDRYPVGTMLFIYPWHSFPTANSYQEYVVHCGQQIVDKWIPVKGW